MPEKRKVTMTNVVYVGKDENGQDAFQRHEATDYVGLDHLDAYVADAAKRWTSVEVGEEHDPGPGGDDGEYVLPEHLANGVELDEHLDSLGVVNRTDADNNPLIPQER